MLNGAFQSLWGNFENKNERLKFIRLSVIFAFTIGICSIFHPTKDIVFIHTVGLDFFPFAKWVSLFMIVPALFMYGKLVDAFPRHRIFYVVCSLYIVIIFLCAYFVDHPFYGVTNTHLHHFRILGWLWYGLVECFGSLLAVLLWSFASDITTPSQAARGFSLLALGAQAGGVVGPLFLYSKAHLWSTGNMMRVGAIGVFCIILLVYYFMRVTPEKELSGYCPDKIKSKEKNKERVSFLEGLRLIRSEPYLLSILAIVVFYNMTEIIIEFHAKIMGKLAYPLLSDYQGFSFKLIIGVNAVAFISLLLGIGNIGRHLKLLKTLMLLPVLSAFGILAIFLKPTLSTAVLVMITIKGLHFALNQPAKEQLYIPTSRASKYKSKAWIDAFGLRAAKVCGSSIHILRCFMPLGFIGASSLFCWMLILIWMVSAFYVGNIHAQALKDENLVC